MLNAERWELIVVRWDADPELQKVLVEVEERFWNDHVLRRVPPTLSEQPIPPSLPPVEDTPITPVAGQDWQTAIMDYREMKAAADAAKSMFEGAKATLKRMAGEHGIYEGEGVRIYFKEQTRKNLDMQALRNARPINPTQLALWLSDRRSIDEIAEAVAEGRMDLDIDGFYAEGKPFDTFRVYDLRPEEEQ